MKLKHILSKMSNLIECEYAVVGGGINGTWAAYHLAEKGHKTVLIEQFPLPHSRGSSHGQTRIIRRAYPEPHVKTMMDRAYELWHQLEDQMQVKLINKVGMLAYGESTREWLSNTVETFKASGGQFKTYSTSSEIMEDFPRLYLNSGSNHVGLLDKEGGFMMAEKCLETTRRSAVMKGCRVVDGFEVKKLEVGFWGEGVSVEGADGRMVKAQGVVICAGSWTNKILEPLNFSLPLYPMVIPSTYWHVNDPNAVPKCAAILDNVSRPNDIPDSRFSPVNHICLLPMHDYPGLIKIYCHQGTYLPDPDLRDQTDVSPAVKDCQNFIRSKLAPGAVEDKPAILEKCLYTMTPDHQQILDWHPIHRNVVIGAGFSGSGFKIAPVTGEMLAEMLTNPDQETKFQKHFVASRFSSP